MNQSSQFSPIISLKIMRLREEIKNIINDPSSEKANDFIFSLPATLNDLHGKGGTSVPSYDISKKRNKTPFDKNDLDFINFEAWVDFMSPSLSKGTHHYNLFYYMFDKFTREKKFTISISQLPKHTQYLINNKRNHSIIQRYLTEFENPNLFNYQEKKITVNALDFYLIIFVAKIREYQSTTHLDFDDRKNINDYLFDTFLKDLQFNPYLVVLRRMLDFFCNDFKLKSYFSKMKFLLEEFLINEYILIVDENQRNLMIPNPHIFESIYLLLHYLQISGEISINKNSLRKNDNNDFNFSKTLFQFLVNVLNFWNKNGVNQKSLLSDLGKVWMKFLKPWESEDPKNFINVLNLMDREQTFDWSYLDYLKKENFNMDEKAESRLFFEKDYFHSINYFFKQNPLFYTEVFHAYISALSDMSNLNFKEILFLKDLIIFFFGNEPKNSILNGHISFSFLNGMLEGSAEGLDVRRYLDKMNISISNLRFFGNEILISKMSQLIYTMNIFVANFRTFTKKSLFSRIKSIWSRNNNSEELANYLEEWAFRIKEILTINFKLSEDYIQPSKLSFSPHISTSDDYNYQIRSTSLRKKNLTWEDNKIRPEESYYLFQIFYFISIFIDLIHELLNKTKMEVAYPTTNLRWFANKRNFTSCLCILLIILIIIVKIVEYIYFSIASMIE